MPTQHISRNARARFWARTSALVLAFAVMGLATVAKSGGFQPRSAARSHLHAAAKMDVERLELSSIRAPLHPITRIAPARPQFCQTQNQELDVPLAENLGLTLALKHRSPPVTIA
jgi:hypothetical protein